MSRSWWKSSTQRGRSSRDFDDSNGALSEFSGGSLPRRTGARLAAMNFALLALRYQDQFEGEDLIWHMLNPSIVEVSVLKPLFLVVQS